MSSPRIPLAVVVPVAVGLLIGGAIVIHRQSSPSPASAPATSQAVQPGAGLIVSSNHLDFGAMEIGQSVVRPLLLRNGGSAPIHVNIETAGSGWTVEPAQLTLEPGGIQRVKVVGTRSDSGAVRGEIRIVSDRPSDDAVLVALEGGATASNQDIAAQLGASETGAVGSVLGAVEPRYGQPGSAGAAQGVSLPRTSAPDARVGVTGARSDSPYDAARPGAPGNDSLSASAAGSTGSVVPFDPANARLPRRISDRPSTPSADRPPRNGEEPVPLNPQPGDTGSDPTTEPPVVGVSAFVISPTSTMRLLGTRNQFYAQQINVAGNSVGGSFSLGSPLQMPRIPLAFGQSMEFTQNGSAVGSYDAGSGQVTMQLPISAVDSNGNSAPIVFSMTTGTVVTRNANGVLVSLTGQPRSADGQLRMVGIAKIPTGFRNGAEQQLVTIDVVGSLTLASPTSARNDSDAASGGAQENL